MAERLWAVHIQMELPQFETQWYAIFRRGPGHPRYPARTCRVGPQCISNPHTTIRGARVVWHQLNTDDRAQMIKAFKGCPFPQSPGRMSLEVRRCRIAPGSATMPQSTSPKTFNQMVFYDLPPRLEASDIKQMFTAKGKEVGSAARLSWTSGDISLSAWQVTGGDLMDLNGVVVRDPCVSSPCTSLVSHIILLKPQNTGGKLVNAGLRLHNHPQDRHQAISGNPVLCKW